MSRKTGENNFPSMNRHVQKMQETQIDINLDRSAEMNIGVFRNAVRNVRSNPPSSVKERMSPEEAGAILTDIEREYEGRTQALKERIRGLYVNGPHGAPPDRRWLQDHINLYTQENINDFNKAVRQRHGEKGEILLLATADESAKIQQGPIGRVMSKIGTNGGMIGAIAGGLTMFAMAGGLGGGVLAIAAAGVGALAAGVLGGHINDWLAQPRTPSASPTPPAQGAGSPAPDGKTAPERQQEQLKNQPPPQEELTTGNLSPSAIPNAPPATPKHEKSR